MTTLSIPTALYEDVVLWATSSPVMKSRALRCVRRVKAPCKLSGMVMAGNWSTPDATRAPTRCRPINLWKAGLEISKLTFAYDSQPDPVLRDLSLKIEPGEMVALQGVSGAGKTTLLDLLTGLLQPNNGAILADRQPLITEADRRAWRAQVAYLPQDPFLFDDTIRSNLAWSAPDVQEDAVWAALDLASASEFVRATPEGLDTRAGDRGQKFSGGERQRLCIARALLRRPRLMILDEATSALDRQTEEEIMERLKDRRADFSVLLITHREESLRHADRVYRLENGSCTHV